MFGFLSMIDNYEQRKVDNTRVGDAEIDTVRVTDSRRPYETGIAHPRYNGGRWVIVEMYDSESLAKLGHAKWVKVFANGKEPKQLVDVNESDINDLAGAFGRTTRGTYNRKV